MWDLGSAYALPMSEHLMAETESSSLPETLLLPSPQSSESTPTDDLLEEIRANMADPHERLYLPGRKWHTQRTLSRIAGALLPTPLVGDAEGGRTSKGSKRPGETGLRGQVKKLLPTPGANDSTGGEGPTRDERRRTGDTGGPSLRDLPHLLPTPASRDGKGPNPNEREGGDDLPGAIRLLPTPVVTDSYGSRRSTARTEEWESNPGTSLTDAIWETQGRTEDTRGNPTGASMQQPSSAGSSSSDGSPPDQLTIEGA
jgi:hypothetical protein